MRRNLLFLSATGPLCLILASIAINPNGATANTNSIPTKNKLTGHEKLLEHIGDNSTYSVFHHIFQFLDSLSSNMLSMNQRLTSLESEVFKNRTKNVTLIRLEKPKVDLYALKKGMLDDPKAKLYSEENFTGLSEDYNFSATDYEGGCYDLKTLRRKVKSVETYGKCVRLFYGQLCIGWSVAVYPGSQNSDKVLNEKLSQVESIGPCLPDEFEHSEFDTAENDTLVQKLYTDVPDMVEICSLEKFYKATRPLEIPKLLTYLLGPFNRVELLVALIHPTLLNVSQTQRPKMEESAFYKSLQKQPGDVVGYGIPGALGGPLNESFNIFPQSQQGKVEWGNITSAIRSMILSENNSNRARGSDIAGPEILAQVALNFMYGNESETRPYAFYYWVHLRAKQLFYGRILN